MLLHTHTRLSRVAIESIDFDRFAFGMRREIIFILYNTLHSEYNLWEKEREREKIFFKSEQLGKHGTRYHSFL